MSAQKVGASTDLLVGAKSRWGRRHFVVLQLFLGMANAYIMRTNMSIAIVAMTSYHKPVTTVNICGRFPSNDTSAKTANNDTAIRSQKINNAEVYDWTSTQQGWVLSAFFYGYILTQFPFTWYEKKFGAKKALGYGMLLNSLVALFVPYAASLGYIPLMVVRFIQGLGEGPIVPSTHAFLSRWSPKGSRSQNSALVYAGAQLGTIVSMPISGLLAGSVWGWPSIFYFFSLLGIVWSITFILFVSYDPNYDPKISEEERKYLQETNGSVAFSDHPSTPWKKIATSVPFWAILFAHMAHNYGYETLLTQLPSYMRQILNFDIESNGIISSIPYLAMWICSMICSKIADLMITSSTATTKTTRRIFNTIGEVGPAVALVAVSFTGCSAVWTVILLTAGLALNSAIYSGFKVNHLDISPTYSGNTMSITNCLANVAGVIAPTTAGWLTREPSLESWGRVFLVASAVYLFGASVFFVLVSGKTQPWNVPKEDIEMQRRFDRITHLVEGNAANGANTVSSDNSAVAVPNKNDIPLSENESGPSTVVQGAENIKTGPRVETP